MKGSVMIKFFAFAFLFALIYCQVFPVKTPTDPSQQTESPKPVVIEETVIGFVQDFNRNTLLIENQRGIKELRGIANIEEFKKLLEIAQKGKIPVIISSQTIYDTSVYDSAGGMRIIQGIEPLDKDLIFPRIPGRQLPLETRGKNQKNNPGYGEQEISLTSAALYPCQPPPFGGFLLFTPASIFQV